MTQQISIAETAAKALNLYMCRAHTYYRNAKETPNRDAILSAYGRIRALYEDISYDYAWIRATVDSIHSELVNGLIGVTTDEAVITLMRNDPVLRYEAELLSAPDKDFEEEEA